MSHHWGTDIACSVKAVDDAAVVPQSTSVDIGADTALGPQVARNHLGAIIGRVADLAEVRIGLVARVAVVAIVGTFPAVVVLVDTGPGECVETLDGGSEFVRG
ncbi:Uncharacterised protein [Mycobacterium tuberculosis]|nr:Uncharacterised protein [Mycobacterium tuberculosis]